MPLLRLRVSDELTDFLTEIAIWCDKLEGSQVSVCCEEFGKKGKKHIHLLTKYELPTGKDSMSKFRRLLTARFPTLVGNQCLSLTESENDKKTPDKYTPEELFQQNLRYVCKGDTPEKEPTILLANISHEEIIEHQKQFWANNLRYCQQQTLIRITEQNQIHKEKTRKKQWLEKVVIEFIREHQIPEPQPEMRLEQLYKGGAREVEWTQPSYCHILDGQYVYIRQWDFNISDMTYIHHYIHKKLGEVAKGLDHFIVMRFGQGLLNALAHGDCEALNQFTFKKAYPELCR